MFIKIEESFKNLTNTKCIAQEHFKLTQIF